MSDRSRAVVEQTNRLPVWARVLIGVAGVCLLSLACIAFARQASIDAANAIVAGGLLAAWIVVYVVMRRRTRKPPR